MKTVAELIDLTTKNKLMKLPANVQAEVPLTQQGLDSLDLVMLLYEVEQNFAVRIPQEQTSQLRSLQDIVNFLNTNGADQQGA